METSFKLDKNLIIQRNVVSLYSTGKFTIIYSRKLYFFENFFKIIGSMFVAFHRESRLELKLFFRQFKIVALAGHCCFDWFQFVQFHFFFLHNSLCLLQCATFCAENSQSNVVSSCELSLQMHWLFKLSVYTIYTLNLYMLQQFFFSVRFILNGKCSNELRSISLCQTKTLEFLRLKHKWNCTDFLYTKENEKGNRICDMYGISMEKTS